MGHRAPEKRIATAQTIIGVYAVLTYLSGIPTAIVVEDVTTRCIDLAIEAGFATFLTFLFLGLRKRAWWAWLMGTVTFACLMLCGLVMSWLLLSTLNLDPDVYTYFSFGTGSSHVGPISFLQLACLLGLYLFLCGFPLYFLFAGRKCIPK